MTHQSLWDEYESVILLEGLLATEAGQATREETVCRVSRTLRQMAVARGFQVDERYRNENGIFLQLNRMESAYIGKTIHLPATKMFLKIVSLYREDRSAFDKLLREAKTMAGVPISVENDFLQYLAAQVKPGRLPALTACYDEIEAFCQGRKILKDPLFETTDVKVIQSVRDTIEGNRLFKVQHRKQHKDYVEACRYYYNYIKQGLFLRSSVPDEEQNPDTAALASELEVAPVEDTVTAMTPEGKQASAEDTVAATIQEDKPEPAEEPLQEDSALQVPKERARVARKSGLPASGKTPEDWICYNFSNHDAFTGTEPVFCATGWQIVEGNSWTEVLVHVTERELHLKNHALSDLYAYSLLSHQAGEPYFMKEKKEGLACVRLSNGYWINVNYADSVLVTLIGAFCLHCGYSREQVELYGAAKETATPDELSVSPAQRAGGQSAQTNAVAGASDSDASVSEKTAAVKIQDDWIRFDFSNYDDFAGTIPVYCAVDGQVVEENSWNRILWAITDLEIQKGNTALSDLYDFSLIEQRKNIPYLMKEKKGGQNCLQLSNGYWINVNYNLHSIMRMIGEFCLHCGYSREQVELYGAAKEANRPFAVPIRPTEPPVQRTVGRLAQTNAAAVAGAFGSGASVSKKATAVEIQDDWIRYNFSNFDDFAGTAPAYCSVDGQVVKGKNWGEILAAVTDREVRSGNPKISDLYTDSLLSHKPGSPYFIEEEIEGRKCIQLSNGYWINVQFNVATIMTLIGAFCLHCGYRRAQIMLYGAAKDVDRSADAFAEPTAPLAQRMNGSTSKTNAAVAVSGSDSPVGKKPEAIEIQDDWIRFNFSNFAAFTGTVPAYCAVDGQVVEGKNWYHILGAITELEIQKSNEALSDLYSRPLIAQNRNLPYFMKEKTANQNCILLSNGYWINVNYNLREIMRMIGEFCLHCGYSKDQVEFYGAAKEAHRPSAVPIGSTTPPAQRTVGRPSQTSVAAGASGNDASISIKAAAVEIQDDWIRYDFSNFNDFTGTVPVYCAVDGQILEGNSWDSILGAITELEIQKGNEALSDLYSRSLLDRNKITPYFMKKKISSLSCIWLSNGYWINVSYSLPVLMKIIGEFCLHCGYSKEQVELYGAAKEAHRPSAVPIRPTEPPVQRTVGRPAQTNAAAAAGAFGSGASVSKKATAVEIQDDWIRFDFSNFAEFTRTAPVYCVVDGQVLEGKTWYRILGAITEHEIQKGNGALSDLYFRPLIAQNGNMPYFMKEKTANQNCIQLSNGYWINVNHNLRDIMRMIGEFCLHCGYSKEQVELYGAVRGTSRSHVPTARPSAPPAQSPVLHSTQTDSAVTADASGGDASVSKKAAAVKIQDDWIRFDFSNFADFPGTVPAYCAIDGQVLEGKSWDSILGAITDHEIRKRNEALSDLYSYPLITENGNTPFFMKNKSSLRCIQLSNGYWIDVCHSLSVLMKMIGEFCLHCGYSKEQVELYGAVRGTSRSHVPPVRPSSPAQSPVWHPTQTNAAVIADASGGDASVSKKPAAVKIQDDWIRYDFSNFFNFIGTVPAYCAVDGQVLKGKSWDRILGAITNLEIQKGNTALSDLYECSLLDRSSNTPYLMKEEKAGINCIQLSNGYWINVNYNIHSIMRMIGAFCLHCGYSKEQVELYGVARGGRENAGSRPSVSRTTSRSGGQEIFLNKAEEYLQSVGLSGASVGQIAKTLQPGVSVSALTKALGDSPRVICFHGGRYVHADCLVDLDEAEETMRGILRGHFAQFEGYSNDQLLFSAASAELSMFLNDNDCDNKEDVYAIARHFFEKGTADGERYTFRSPHIFQEPPDYPTTLRGLMIHLARCGDGILRANDAKTFLEKTMLTYGGLNQLLKIDSQATFLLYDEGTYLLSDMLGIDKAWCLRLGERLDDLFRTEDVAYAVLRDISTEWLDTLPTLPQNLQWNRLLLQEVLRNYPDVGFRPIRADLHQTFDTLAAAIVPTESPLQTFPDVVWLYMEEHATLPVRMTGEELRRTLQGAGMLAVGEMISSLPKALHDYRFAWDGENKTVYILSG